MNWSVGELFDKISILEIKRERIKDAEKLSHIDLESKRLHELIRLLPSYPAKYKELVKVNTVLWNIEDEIREKDRLNEHDSDFVTLSRAVFKVNGERSRLKNGFDSEIQEQKHYMGETHGTPRETMYLHTHNGMGDLILCNGMVREMNEKYDMVLAVLNIYLENVMFMFRDLLTVTFFSRDTNTDILRDYKSEVIAQHYILLGMNVPNGFFFSHDFSFPSGFYKEANIDSDVIFTKFFLLRDRHMETLFYEQVLRKYNLEKGQPYVIIQDDPSRFTCNTSLVPEKSIPIYTRDFLDTNIFMFRKLIENAEAFHGFDSSFMWFIQLCKVQVRKKYCHLYAKNTSTTFMHTYFGSHRPHDWILVSAQGPVMETFVGPTYACSMNTNICLLLVIVIIIYLFIGCIQ